MDILLNNGYQNNESIALTHLRAPKWSCRSIINLLERPCYLPTIRPFSYETNRRQRYWNLSSFLNSPFWCIWEFYKLGRIFMNIFKFGANINEYFFITSVSWTKRNTISMTHLLFILFCFPSGSSGSKNLKSFFLRIQIID